MKLNCRSLSLVGLGWPFSRKVEDISEMVFRIVSEAKVSQAGHENRPCQRDMAKAPMILFR